MVGAVLGEQGVSASAHLAAHVYQPAHPARPQVELLSGPIPMLRQSQEEWVRLADQCRVDPACHPGALLAFLETVTPGADVAMINVARGERLIGALPLLKETAQLTGVPVRRLRTPGRIDSPDRFDILCSAADSPSVVRSMWAALACRRDWDVLELVDLPEGGPGWQLLEVAREHGYRVGSRVSRQTPYIALDPALPLEANLSATTAKFRANVRRRRRNLKKRGKVELIRSTVYNDALFSRFLELEHAGWKGRNGTSILSDPVDAAYHRRLAKDLSENGLLAMYALECDGEPVAMHFGTAVADRYAIPKVAFDEQYHELAPGHLLIWAVLEDLLARGFTEFDFLGDAKPWKFEWTDQLRVHHRAHIFNKTAAGRLARAIRYEAAPCVKRLARKTPLLAEQFGSEGRVSHR